MKMKKVLKALAKGLKSLARPRHSYSSTSLRASHGGADGGGSNADEVMRAAQGAAEALATIKRGIAHVDDGLLENIQNATKSYPVLISRLTRIRDRALVLEDHEMAQEVEAVICRLRSLVDGVEGISDEVILGATFLIEKGERQRRT